MCGDETRVDNICLVRELLRSSRTYYGCMHRAGGIRARRDVNDAREHLCFCRCLARCARDERQTGELIIDSFIRIHAVVQRSSQLPESECLIGNYPIEHADGIGWLDIERWGDTRELLRFHIAEDLISGFDIEPTRSQSCHGYLTG